MQKLLIYEMTVVNDTTKRAATTRDVMNLNLIAFYEHLFEPAKINIKSISAILAGGIYYLILHKDCAKICAIDFGTPEGEKAFSEGVDFLTDAIFDKLEAYNKNKEAVRLMLSDGVSETKICKYLGITKNELKMLLTAIFFDSQSFGKTKFNFTNSLTYCTAGQRGWHSCSAAFTDYN